MNVNENIALVVIGWHDQSVETTSQIKDNTNLLLQLWSKHRYTIININIDSVDGTLYFKSFPDATTTYFDDPDRILDGLGVALQKNPFSRLVIIGIIECKILEILVQFAQISGVLLYQVSDVLSFERCGAMQLDALVKKVTTRQIMTLSKVIRDKV